MIQPPFTPIGSAVDKIKSTLGHYITLESGQKLFDLQAGGSANMLGHNVSELRAVKVGNYCSDWDLVGPVWGELEKEFNTLIGSEYDLLIPQLTGSDAVDTAIRLAWMTNSGKVIVRPNSYHSGSVVGWQMADREKEYTRTWNKCDWFIEADSDDNPNDIRRILSRGGCSAILVDALTWQDGLRFMPDEYWHEVAALAIKYNVPLIVDEVLTGFGKLGAWSYFINVLGIEPDIVIFGKNMTGGHDALSMVCVHEKYSTLLTGKFLPSGNTKSFNECGAAVTLKNIELLKQDMIFHRLESVVFPFLKELELDINTSGKAVCSVYGSVMSIDCGSYVKNYKFHLKMKKAGYWQRMWKMPYFHIFYNITELELESLKDAILKSI